MLFVIVRRHLLNVERDLGLSPRATSSISPHYASNTPYTVSAVSNPVRSAVASLSYQPSLCWCPMQRALAGLIVAAALAVSASSATFFGIAAWKIALAAAGAVIFVMGAERRPRGGR